MTELNEWDNHLKQLIKVFKNGDDGLPLDGDEVDDMIKIMSAKINLIE